MSWFACDIQRKIQHKNSLKNIFQIPLTPDFKVFDGLKSHVITEFNG